jgi:uncharacterized protein (TIGR00159 family)
MFEFGIKDVVDIVIVGLMLYYLYKMMKNSGTLSLFYGVLAFIAIWVLASEIFDMRLTGTILDKFMNIGLIVLVVLFQEQIKRFLIDIGSQDKWKFIGRLFSHNKEEERDHSMALAVLYACTNMSKTKTGALIVIEQKMPLDNYKATGDEIDADINMRLIENIFFKNSPLHDGAMIISKGRVSSVGCILPVSHDMNLPKNLGLRHRAALGISQVSDAVCVVVSEETGNISIAKSSSIQVKVSGIDLEKELSQALET